MNLKAVVNDWMKKIKDKTYFDIDKTSKNSYNYVDETSEKDIEKTYKNNIDTVLFYKLFEENRTLSSEELEAGYEFSGCSECTTEDSCGLPHGVGTVTKRKTWVWPVYSGFGHWKATKLYSIDGRFVHGALEGPATLYYCDGTYTQVSFVGGVMEGLMTRYFGEELIWAGHLSEGAARGWCWAREPEAGGALVGQVDIQGNHTGDHIIYLYPNYETALVGKFRTSVMETAYRVKVEGVWEEEDLLVISVSRLGEEEYRHGTPTRETFGGGDPLLRDPYEDKMVSVRQSRMEGGGQGVYAKTSLPPGTVAAIYNGHRIPMGQNPAKEEEAAGDDKAVYERLSYNIHMPEDAEFFLDVPPSMADLTIYRATLGHKVNHSFFPNCEFGTMFHPRWGRVRTVRTTQTIAEGEELFVNYGYNLLRCPDWYWALWHQQCGHLGVSWTSWS